MKGLSEKVDLGPFVGRQLVQVCFGAWIVVLLFDGPVRIVVESSIILSNTGGSRSIDDFRADASVLCKLIGQNVAGANRTSTGGMTLHMSSGTHVEITNSSSEHESFQIHIGNEILVA